MAQDLRSMIVVFGTALPPLLDGDGAPAVPALAAVLHPESDVDALLAQSSGPGGSPAVAMLVVADLPQPLALARRLHRAWPLAGIVFHCTADESPAWRQRIGPGAALGRHWCVLDETDPLWMPTLQHALANARRRLKARTTLDRANARISAAAPALNIAEYQRLVASTHHLANFLRHSRDAVFGIDAARQVLFWNNGAERLLGLAATEAIGRDAAALPRFGPALRQALELVENGKPTATVEVEDAADHAPRTLEFVVSSVHGEGNAGATVFVHDVTAQRAAHVELQQANQALESLVTARTHELQSSQQALLQAQKLESIGQLTGGVAHDFNNVLQIIGSNLQLLLSAPADAADNRFDDRLVHTALRAVDRGARLTGQLLAFARRQPLNPAPLNLNRLVEGLDDMLRRTLGEEIRVETSLAGALWTTLADAAQLENVLVNLAINARDAMPGGGRLTIETANAALDESYADSRVDVSPGEYVLLAVSDTGTGMPPEVLAQAFEPFFTTKPEGKGTGLGLSMAYGFAKQSGGHLRLYSEVGVGTTVRLYLPRTHAADIPMATVRAGPVEGGSETILVVEDDPEVQAGAVNMLAGLGYRVLRAGDAQQALDLIEGGAQVDLLFTDVVMPGALRSPEMVRQATRRLPGLAVLYTSGYTQNAIVHGGRLDAGVELLSKPYRREDLARRVRQLLARRPGEPGPAADTDTDTDAEAGAMTSVAGASTPQRATILFVEDEPDARSTTHLLLEVLGYPVVSVDSAEAAMRQLERRPFDILLTDITLRGASGITLAVQAVAMHPSLKVVFASGHGEPPALPAGFRSWHLTKPYVAELEATLARVASLPDPSEG